MSFNYSDIICLKPFVRVYRVKSTTFCTYASAKYEIEDSNGYVYYVLNTLKSHVQVQDLQHAVRCKFGDKDNEMLYTLLQNLDDSLLIQKEYPKYDYFDEQYYERYERNFTFFDSFCSINHNRYKIQKNLKNRALPYWV